MFPLQDIVFRKVGFWFRKIWIALLFLLSWLKIICLPQKRESLVKIRFFINHFWLQQIISFTRFVVCLLASSKHSYPVLNCIYFFDNFYNIILYGQHGIWRLFSLNLFQHNITDLLNPIFLRTFSQQFSSLVLRKSQFIHFMSKFQ